MKKILLPSLIVSLLIGCSSSVPTPNLDQFSNYTGGQTMGDATSLYWYTERLTFPYTAADYVAAGDYGWYKTDYRWDEGELRELIREGEQLKDSELVPYRIHVRFNKDGDAIYQQHRLDGRVLPLKADKIAWLKQEALNIADVAKQQSSNGMRLIQGYWDGTSFDACNGKSYEQVEFNETLPSFVVNRLSSVDSYAAFIGSTRSNKVVVNELLMLSDDSHDCIERPSLIEE
ncbi:peptidylprolyl isomerase [Vibrio xuii]|nr:peptidylprolyl isomerase [Vibrio xuii]